MLTFMVLGFFVAVFGAHGRRLTPMPYPASPTWVPSTASWVSRRSAQMPGQHIDRGGALEQNIASMRRPHDRSRFAAQMPRTVLNGVRDATGQEGLLEQVLNSNKISFGASSEPHGWKERDRQLDRGQPISGRVSNGRVGRLVGAVQTSTRGRSPVARQASSTPEADEASVAAAVDELQGRLPADHAFSGNAGALRRFVIARKLDVDAALAMLNKHVEWRAENLPVHLTPEIQAELRKGKFYVLPGGKDVDGNPVVVVRSGLFDPNERDLDTSIKAFIYLLEGSLASVGESGKFCIMYDRDGFSLRENFDFDLLKAWAAIASDNYPERLASVALYPSGVVLAGLYKMVSVFFEPRTRAKIKMVQNEDELAALIPKDALPPKYGGTSTYEFDPDAVYGTAGVS